MKTLEITNLGGPLTRKNYGDINSGLAKHDTSFGYDPFSKPGTLTWLEQPTSILSDNNILVLKQKAEGNTQRNYVYSFDSGELLRRITVNSTTNPNLDSPSIIAGATLTADSQNSGGGMVFFGASDRIFLLGDSTIQTATFSSSVVTDPSLIGTLAVNNAPRPTAKFLGKVYFGNGNNIGEIDTTNTITTVGKLSPALPNDLYVRDLDVTPDGNYLQITASGSNQINFFGTDNADISTPMAADSYKFYWNGVDGSYSSAQNYSGLVLTAIHSFGDKNYSFGYDYSGAGIFSNNDKIVSLPNASSPHPTAVFSTGNMLGFATPEYDAGDGRIKTSFFEYGKFDDEVRPGLYRLLRQRAAVRDDITSVPACINVSNRMRVSSSFGVTNNFSGTGKIYYAATEVPSVSGALQTNLWRFNTVATGTQSILAGVYETQNQQFSKKINVKEVRLYTEPLAADNAFEIDLIGAGGSVLSGGSQGFAVGTNVTAGDDFVRYNPAHAPTHSLGVRITNASVTGTRNWTAVRLELDVVPSGK